MHRGADFAAATQKRPNDQTEHQARKKADGAQFDCAIEEAPQELRADGTGERYEPPSDRAGERSERAQGLRIGSALIHRHEPPCRSERSSPRSEAMPEHGGSGIRLSI